MSAPVPREPAPPRSFADRLLGFPLDAKLVVGNAAVVTAATTAVSWLASTRAAPAELLLLLVAGATAVSLAANALIARSALAPLRELERVAAAVEAGERSARVRLGLVRDPLTERVAVLTNRILDAHQAQQATLAQLTGREMAGREEERRLVARELREEIGQTCAAVAVGLKSLRNALDVEPTDRPALRARADGLIELVHGAYDAVHARAQGLRPSALDDLGLGPALRSAGTRWASALGTSVDVRVEGEPPRPGSPLGAVLYRVAEEAVANAAQHGGAGYVAVTLRTGAGTVELEVVDDGKGFDPANVDPAKALGLLGMRERLALVGGHLHVTSAPGEGTVVVARAPGGVGTSSLDAVSGPAA